MNWVSEKEIYANQLRDIALHYATEYFVWGEDLFDKKLILYNGKLKNVKGYEDVCGYLKPCGFVIIDKKKEHWMRCVMGTLDTKTGNAYLQENTFNGIWKQFKVSVGKGIRQAKEKGFPCQAKVAEDILELENLWRTGSVPKIKNNVICYQMREKPERDRKLEGRKQSMLDNLNMNYYYAEHGKYYHDRECEEIKHILPGEFCASSEIPKGKEICPKCRRKVYFRKACAPNVKQMVVCDRFFQNHQVSLNKIRHCVMEAGMKFHAVTLEELTIQYREDTWIVKAEENQEENQGLQLWHNNYVKINETERYITDGFHNQGLIGFSLTQILSYIEKHTWENHLLKEEKKKMEAEALNLEEKEVMTADLQTKKTWYDRLKAWMKKLKERLRDIKDSG